MARSVSIVGLFVAALLAGACSDDAPVCKLADNKSAPVSIDYGKAIELSPKLCGVKKPDEVAYTWALAGQAAGNGPSYRFLACPRFKGLTTPVKVNVEYGGKSAHHTWDVTVRDVPPAYPDCSATLTPKDAIAALQRGDLYGLDKGVDFKTAVACLDRALVEYPCDIELAFWAAYGDSIVFAQALAASLAVSGINERTLNAMVDERIDPLITRFDLLAAEMPNDFTARPKDFDFSILTLEIHPGGEWDRGDILALNGGLHLAKGGAKFLAAYNGSLQALQIIGLSGLRIFGPQGFASISPAIQNKLIDLLDEDPAFLALFPKAGPERLAVAQKSLITGLRQMNDAISFVKAEKDDQRDDMFRYFDCGADAICPPDDSRNPVKGDPGEILVKDEAPFGVYNPATDAFIDANGNGKYDAAWIKTGPDQGEGDGQYSQGETIGTDVFNGFIKRVGVPISTQVQNLISELANNIQGPDAMDLTKFLLVSQDRLWQLTLAGGINVPSLRISRWFDGPRDLRDFLPLWSHSKRLFITDSEEEPYEDWGYDKTPTRTAFGYAEPVTLTVKCLPGYFPPAHDPRGDNFDPISNADDGCDNDEDGIIDNVDPVTGRSLDLGVEGNGRFDFKDTNTNSKHDHDELSELFYDTGLVTFGKAPVGANNGKWDAIDMVHYWPKGDDVGGRAVTIVSDPKNGTLQDIFDLIDPVYYFFPDAQFNGVVVFETPTTNKDGYKLSDNAELMRFFAKVVAASRQLVD